MRNRGILFLQIQSSKTKSHVVWSILKHEPEGLSIYKKNVHLIMISAIGARDAFSLNFKRNRGFYKQENQFLVQI